MAIDKNKIIEAATKFVQKGQYDKAIKEYQKLLEVDAKDARIQQKLGELYQKKGDNALAADCFLKVAESYAADGFFLKAVAVYKQVLKLNPSLVDVNLKLAELHQQLGLMSDAMAQFQLVANHYEKVGNLRQSLDTLRKMVDLDPDNVASRIKLAELYAREQMNAEAIAEFGRAAEYLKRNNRVDDYIKVAERLVFLDPNNLELTRELANIYLTKQDTKRALAKLQLCFKADPKDVETLSMLAQAFKDLGQVAKTVSVYKELAKIYDENDRIDEEREVWRKIQDLAPEDPDVRARFPPAPQPVAAPQAAAPARPAAAQPAPARQPAAPASRQPAPAQAAAPQRAPAEMIPRLLTETDVYVKYGLHEKALEHLKKVFAIDPESMEGHEKAADLYSATGNVQAALDSLVRVVRKGIERGDLDRARLALQKLCEKEPTHPEIPGFLNAVGGLAPVEEVAEIEEDAILVEAVDEAIEVAPEPEPAVEDLAAEPVASSDEEALAAAADLAGPEVIAEAPAEEELIAAPSDGDDLALASAESSPDLVDAEPAVEQGFIDNSVEEPATNIGERLAAEGPGDALEDFAPIPESEEPALAAQQAADDEVSFADVAGPSQETAVPEEEFQVSHNSAEFRVPDEEPLPDEGALLEGPGAIEGGEVESQPTMPGRIPISPAARGSFEEELHGHQTRVADLPLSLMQSLAPPVDPRIAKAATIQTEPVSEDEALDEAPEPGEQQTRSLPVLAGAANAPRTQPHAANAQQLLEQAGETVPEPEEPEPPPPEEEADDAGAQDELDEATFFLDQGMLEEAREILETVMLAYPGSQRAKELMGRLEDSEAGAAPTGESTAEQPVEGPAAPADPTDGSFDLASELAGEDLGDLGAPVAPATDDFQVSVDDVFGEFKRGLKKVVKPEDVETHYDLGIAYKEMGLLEDAIGEFEQAAAAAAGKKKEIEALAMVGICRMERGEMAEAAEAFERALALPQVTPDTGKAVHFELGITLEKMGRVNEALQQYMRVKKIDPGFRDVVTAVERLQDAGAEEEHTEPSGKVPKPNGSAAKPGAKPPAGGDGPKGPSNDPKKARKIGYL